MRAPHGGHAPARIGSSGHSRPRRSLRTNTGVRSFTAFLLLSVPPCAFCGPWLLAANPFFWIAGARTTSREPRHGHKDQGWSRPAAAQWRREGNVTSEPEIEEWVEGRAHQDRHSTARSPAASSGSAQRGRCGLRRGAGTAAAAGAATHSGAARTAGRAARQQVRRRSRPASGRLSRSESDEFRPLPTPKAQPFPPLRCDPADRSCRR